MSVICAYSNNFVELYRRDWIWRGAILQHRNLQEFKDRKADSYPNMTHTPTHGRVPSAGKGAFITFVCLLVWLRDRVLMFDSGHLALTFGQLQDKRVLSFKMMQPCDWGFSPYDGWRKRFRAPKTWTFSREEEPRPVIQTLLALSTQDPAASP